MHVVLCEFEYLPEVEFLSFHTGEDRLFFMVLAIFKHPRFALIFVKILSNIKGWGIGGLFLLLV